MIQRIQTVWLLLAAIVMTGVFYFPIYKFPQGQEMIVGSDFGAVALTGLSILLSLVALLSFKNRKNQLKLCWLNMLCCLVLLVWLFYSVSNFQSKSLDVAAGGYYWIGAFLPLICIVILFMARSGIKKDEKVVKSMDRLR